LKSRSKANDKAGDRNWVNHSGLSAFPRIIEG
jgi:hypothetical protein